MLRLTVSTEEYLMIGEDIRLVFLGGTGKHLRIMVDAPRDRNIVRSTVLEKNITSPEEKAKLPKYYAEVEHPEKYVRKPRTAGRQEGKPCVIVNRGVRDSSGHSGAGRQGSRG